MYSLAQMEKNDTKTVSESQNLNYFRESKSELFQRVKIRMAEAGGWKQGLCNCCGDCGICEESLFIFFKSEK